MTHLGGATFARWRQPLARMVWRHFERAPVPVLMLFAYWRLPAETYRDLVVMLLLLRWDGERDEP
jgi:hypothetical protein